MTQARDPFLNQAEDTEHPYFYVSLCPVSLAFLFQVNVSIRRTNKCLPKGFIG